MHTELMHASLPIFWHQFLSSHLLEYRDAQLPIHCLLISLPGYIHTDLNYQPVFPDLRGCLPVYQFT
jgi:hypothetical protein